MRTLTLSILMFGLLLPGCSDDGQATPKRDTGATVDDGKVPDPDTGPQLVGLTDGLPEDGLTDGLPGDGPMDGFTVDGPVDGLPADGHTDGLPADGPTDGLPADGPTPMDGLPADGPTDGPPQDGYLGSLQRAPDEGWRLIGFKPLAESILAGLPLTARFTIAVHLK